MTIISNPPTSGHTPPPTMPTVRIMRRGASDKQGPKLPPDNRSHVDSSEPSQAASVADEMEAETNKSSAESSAKEKGNLTREEREAKYREARERIFKDFEETEVDERTGAADTSKQASRSSSRTGKNRISSRKHRNNNDDGFEARSQFAAYFPPPQSAMHFQHGVPLYQSYAVHGAGGSGHALGGGPPRDYQAHHIGLVPNPAGMYAEPMVDGMGRPFSSSSSAHSGPSSQSGASSPTYPLGDYGFSPFQAPVSGHYFPQYRPTVYPHSQVPGPHWFQHPPPQNPYQADITSATVAHQGNHYPHMNPHMPDHQGPLQFASGVANASYQFGRLPSQFQAQPGYRVNYQHPLPGSFSRRAFNPQTLPFVPHGPHATAMNHSPIPPSTSHSGMVPAQYPPSSSGSAHATHDMGAMQPAANFPNAVMMLNVSSSPSSSQASGAKYHPAPPGQGNNAAFTGHHHASKPDRHGPRNEQPRWEHPSGGLPPKPVVSSSMMHSPKARVPPAERRHAASYSSDAPPAIVNGSRIPVTSSPIPVSSAANA